MISVANQDVLFNEGVLGDDSLLKLLRTTIYMSGLHCALWCGTEHNKLRRPGFESQITIDRDE